MMFNNSGYNNITNTCLSSNETNNSESEIVFPKSNPKMEERVHIDSKHHQTIKIGSFSETDKDYLEVWRRTLWQNNKQKYSKQWF